MNGYKWILYYYRESVLHLLSGERKLRKAEKDKRDYYMVRIKLVWSQITNCRDTLNSLCTRQQN